MGLFSKDLPLTPAQVSEIKAAKQRYLRAVRAGGYGKAAQRDQKRADALRRQRGEREE